MGVFEAIKNGFSVARKNLKLWLLLVVISFVLMAVSVPIAMAVLGPEAFQPGAAAPTPTDLGLGGGIVFGAMVIAMVLVQIFVNAGTVGCIKNAVKTGSLNLANFVENAKKFFVRFFLFSIAMLIIMAIIFIALLLIGGLAGIIGNKVAILGGLLGIITFVAFVAAAICAGLYGAMGPIVIAAEDKSLIESMTKCLDFVKEKLWKIIALGLMFALMFLAVMAIMFIVFFAVGLVLGASGGAEGLSQGAQVTINLLSRILWNLAGTYLTIVFVSSMMSYYLGNSAGTEAPSGSA